MRNAGRRKLCRLLLFCSPPLTFQTYRRGRIPGCFSSFTRGEEQNTNEQILQCAATFAEVSHGIGPHHSVCSSRDDRAGYTSRANEGGRKWKEQRLSLWRQPA